MMNIQSTSTFATLLPPTHLDANNNNNNSNNYNTTRNHPRRQPKPPVFTHRLARHVLPPQLAPAPIHPDQRLARLHLPLLHMHLLPQPALRLLLPPPPHPLPHVVQLVRPVLLRLQQRLVPAAPQRRRLPCRRLLPQRHDAARGQNNRPDAGQRRRGGARRAAGRVDRLGG